MEFVQQTTHKGPLNNGALVGTTFTQTFSNHRLPMTLTLGSSSGTRSIQLSTDNGVTYFTPAQYDAITTGMINVVVKGPITNVLFTGLNGDLWSIR